MKKFKLLAALLLAMVLVLGLVACGNDDAPATADTAAPDAAAPDAPDAGDDNGDAPPPAEGYLIIGNPQPLSGINAQVGQTTTNAAIMAVEHINEVYGGFNGQLIQLINYDDQNTPEVAVQVAQRMLVDDQVDLVLGTLLSSNLMATGDMFEEAGILVMGNGTSPTLLIEGWETMFRVAPNNGEAMPALIGMAIDNGWSTAALIHGLDDATRSAGEAFTEAAEGAGITMVATETYIDGDVDFAGQIASIMAADPDFLFMSTNGPTFPLVVNQLRLMDFEGGLFFRESPTADAIAIAGQNMDGIMFVYPYNVYDYPEQAEDPLMQEFLARYYERWGEMPFHDAAYRAWDAMMAMLHASRIAGSNDSASMIEAMHQVHFRGLGGYLDFRGGDNEAHPQFRVWEMQGGRPVAVG